MKLLLHWKQWFNKHEANTAKWRSWSIYCLCACPYYSINMRLHEEFRIKKLSEITDNRRWWYDVGSDENVFVDRRDFPEVCCRPKRHHLCFLGVHLKALRRASVVQRLHTSSKHSSNVTNVGRLAMLDALAYRQQTDGGGHDAARKRWTNLVALICTFSIFSISICLHGDQMQLAYSWWDRI